jgi:hypothetical protein
MKTLFKIAIVALFAFIATTTAYAQEWTKAQLEVWQVVEDGWTKWKAGDISGMTASIHDKYQGWSYDSPLPMSKAQVIQWYQAMKDMMKAENFELNPARIVVMENAAVVDYYYMYSATMTMGDKKEQKMMQGKNAEFYIKEKGKWLLIGDMTTHEKMEGM